MNKITVNHEKISCLLSSPIQNPPEGIARIPTTSEKRKQECETSLLSGLHLLHLYFYFEKRWMNNAASLSYIVPLVGSVSIPVFLFFFLSFQSEILSNQGCIHRVSAIICDRASYYFWSKVRRRRFSRLCTKFHLNIYLNQVSSKCTCIVYYYYTLCTKFKRPQNGLQDREYMQMLSE
jgi:hypothetical protein